MQYPLDEADGLTVMTLHRSVSVSMRVIGPGHLIHVCYSGV